MGQGRLLQPPQLASPRPTPTAESVIAASTVGLLAPVTGQGPCLAAAALFPSYAQGPRLNLYDDALARARAARRTMTLAANTVGLLGSPDGTGLWSATEALVRDRPSPPRPPQRAEPAAPLQPPQHVAEPAAPWQPPVANAPAQAAGGLEASIAWMILLGLGAVVVIAVVLLRPGKASAGRICIVALPPGEAPENIRQAWIGLELPFTGAGRPVAVVGVLSRDSAGRCEGYEVDGATAVRLLAANAPDAAAWWRRHAPHVLASGYQLVFPAEVCEHVG
jgi:hypothetical protein